MLNKHRVYLLKIVLSLQMMPALNLILQHPQQLVACLAVFLMPTLIIQLNQQHLSLEPNPQHLVILCLAVQLLMQILVQHLVVCSLSQRVYLILRRLDRSWVLQLLNLRKSKMIRMMVASLLMKMMKRMKDLMSKLLMMIKVLVMLRRQPRLSRLQQ